VALHYQLLKQSVVLGVSEIVRWQYKGRLESLPTQLGRAIIWGAGQLNRRPFLKKIKLIIGLTGERATQLIVELLNRGC